MIHTQINEQPTFERDIIVVGFLKASDDWRPLKHLIEDYVMYKLFRYQHKHFF